MNRAERRRQKRAEKKPATYTLTADQIEKMKQEAVREWLLKNDHRVMSADQMRRLAEEEVQKQATAIRQEGMDAAQTTALLLTFKVLMEDYWPRTFRRRAPGFVRKVLDYYELWDEGKLDMGDVVQELIEYGGVELKWNGGDD